MDKQRLRIGLVQLQATPAKDVNLGKILQHIDSLGSSCGLVVFPEYCMGYPSGKLTREFVHEIAEPLNGGFVKRVAEKSKTHGSTVVLPIFERDGETVFNTSVIVTDGRVIGKYRKIHLFDAFGFRESEFFGHGTEMVLFSARGITRRDYML